MVKQRHVYIIGAGMSGLSTALRMAELGEKVTLIESESTIGGLAGSFSWGDFTHVDLGPHIYHTPDNVLEAYWRDNYGELFYENEFWGQNVVGENFDTYYDYPLSFSSLKAFPEEKRTQILDELGRLDEVKKAKAKNYSEYVRELVGPTLMQEFFVKYPQKLWGIPIEEMTANWAPKRIDLRKEHKHFHAGQWSAVGKYGSGKILEKMADDFRTLGGTLRLDASVTGFEHSEDVIHKIVIENTSDFNIEKEDLIVSTIPLPVTAKYLGITNELEYRGAKLVYVAVDTDVVLHSNISFLYYDAPEISFHRVSEQKKFCPVGFPEGKTFLTCEIAYTKGDELDNTDEKIIIQKTIEDLIKVGLVTKKQVYDTKIISLPNVYPLLTKESEEELVEVQSRLASFKQLYGLGTGGDFHYADLQILNIQGFDLAERLSNVQNSEEIESVKNNYTEKFNQSITFDTDTISELAPPFIIAEIGLNHNGSKDLAKELVQQAKDIGCSAVKFQTYKSENRVSKQVKANRYAEELINTEESVFDMLTRLELSFEDYKELFEFAHKIGIQIFSTPFDLESVDLLESLDVSLYKISSMDVVNLPLIKRVAETHKPLLLSTGMSTLGQIEDAVNTVKMTGNKNLILLHCVSSYPAATQDINLKVMNTLKQAYGTLVGFSDHTIGLTASTVALVNGATVIERHFTLDRFMEGPDHILSSDVDEMRELVRLGNLIPVIQGRGEKVIQASETEAISRFKKALYAKCDIKKGQVITEDMITIKGPGGGILPKYTDIILGRVAQNNISADYPIRWQDI